MSFFLSDSREPQQTQIFEAIEAKKQVVSFFVLVNAKLPLMRERLVH
jgi:hypothetical protein